MGGTINALTRSRGAAVTRALIVYYSEEEITHRVAAQIARATGFDVDPISYANRRSGLAGKVRNALENRTRHVPRMRCKRNPADYDLVIIGTPVCQGTMAGPVRTYLEQHAQSVRSVAFFCTMRSRGAWETVRELAYLSGREPCATLIASDADVRCNRHRDSLSLFVEELRDQLEPIMTMRPAEAA